MKQSKHKFITRMIWTKKGLAAFEDEVNMAIAGGWVPRGVEFSRGALRTLCMAMLEMPPAKCDCDCTCCIEIHQGTCDCECDCCIAHKHRDGSYHNDDEDEDEED